MPSKEAYRSCVYFFFLRSNCPRSHPGSFQILLRRLPPNSIEPPAFPPSHRVGTPPAPSHLYLFRSHTHLIFHSCSCMRLVFAPTLPRLQQVSSPSPLPRNSWIARTHRSPGAGKPMEPSKALKARYIFFTFIYISFSYNDIRNLFAIDYLKDHPDTTSANFKPVFDHIDEDTHKVFTLLILRVVTN